MYLRRQDHDGAANESHGPQAGVVESPELDLGLIEGKGVEMMTQEVDGDDRGNGRDA